MRPEFGPLGGNIRITVGMATVWAGFFCLISMSIKLWTLYIESYFVGLNSVYEALWNPGDDKWSSKVFPEPRHGPFFLLITAKN